MLGSQNTPLFLIQDRKFMREKERGRERERESSLKNFIKRINEKKIKYGYRIEKKIFIESLALERYFLIRQTIIKKKKLKKLLQKETNKSLILLISDLFLYSYYIENSKRPLIIFHLADEAYNFSNSKIYKNKNIKFIIRHSKIFPLFFLLKSSLKWPLVTFKWIYSYWIYNVLNNNLPINENLRDLKHILSSIKILCKHIIFSYLIRKIEKKIIYAPLNETNFYKKEANSITTKKYSISFSGAIHSSERKRLNLIAKEIGFSNGYAGWGWASEKSLNSQAYSNLFKNSKYSLCPTGYTNLDTFRFYEAITSGSIPIVPKETPFQPFNYYSEIYDIDQRIVLDLFTKSNIKNIIKSISNKDYYLILKNLRRSIELRNKIVKKILNKYCI